MVDSGPALTRDPPEFLPLKKEKINTVVIVNIKYITTGFEMWGERLRDAPRRGVVPHSKILRQSEG
jgi:hypothetical protein